MYFLDITSGSLDAPLSVVTLNKSDNSRSILFIRDDVCAMWWRWLLPASSPGTKRDRLNLQAMPKAINYSGVARRRDASGIQVSLMPMVQRWCRRRSPHAPGNGCIRCNYTRLAASIPAWSQSDEWPSWASHTHTLDRVTGGDIDPTSRERSTMLAATTSPNQDFSIALLLRTARANAPGSDRDDPLIFSTNSSNNFLHCGTDKTHFSSARCDPWRLQHNTAC